MIKKVLLLTTIVALSFNTSYVSFATTLTPAQAIEESKVKYEQLDDTITTLNSEISKLNIEIEGINYKLNATNTEIEETGLQIKLINSQIEEAKADIEKNQEILDKRIRSMYESNTNTDMLIYIMTSDNLLDAFNRVYSMSKIVSLDKQMINEINEKSAFLIKGAEDLSKSQSDLNFLKTSALKDLASVNEKQSTQQESLNELNSQKANVASIIEANEEKLISHQLSIINSDSSTSLELTSAISTLKSLIAQISSDYVLDLANTAILDGQAKIDAIEIENSKNAVINNNNNNNNNNNINNSSTTDNNNNNNNNNNSGTGNSTSGDGEYLATYAMSATAYTGGTITASGLKPIRDPNGISTISVDPSVIPLGSKVLIPGYGYAIASDTGGAIKGNIIDLYLNSHEECVSWGRQNVTLHLIALPGTW
ncbi:3D domain-containing protein [Clostridium gasigenes]|uniref:3D domain-containing protein n=1 Tax=Clostridium gasigenes TaxID=94869 RepID=UPI00209BB214|nr:3D domain-containing protein [Clostridium gasigenes]